MFRILKSNIKSCIIVLSMVSVFVACSDSEGCRQDLTTALHASLHRMVYDSVAEQLVAQTYTVPVYVVGVGQDSVLYSNVITSVLNLPLQMFDTVSSFQFTTFIISNTDTTSVIDTIEIHHSNEQTLVSLECGCAVKNTVSAVTSTVYGIDSIVVVSPYVDYQNTDNNLRIYLRGKR